MLANAIKCSMRNLPSRCPGVLYNAHLTSSAAHATRPNSRYSKSCTPSGWRLRPPSCKPPPESTASLAKCCCSAWAEVLASPARISGYWSIDIWAAAVPCPPSTTELGHRLCEQPSALHPTKVPPFTYEQSEAAAAGANKLPWYLVATPAMSSYRVNVRPSSVCHELIPNGLGGSACFPQPPLWIQGEEIPCLRAAHPLPDQSRWNPGSKLR